MIRAAILFTVIVCCLLLKNAFAQPTWQIDVTASIGDYTDQDGYVGGAEGATFGFDVDLDFPEPPHPPNRFISLYFPHPEWENDLSDNFSTDVVSDTAYLAQVIQWVFVVETDQENQAVSLTFTPTESVDAGFDLILIDVEADSTIRLWETASYAYNPGDGEPRNFRLLYGDLQPPTTTVVQPNGAEHFLSGDQTSIRWDAEDLMGVAKSVIAFSADRGSTWTPIDSTEGEEFELLWNIPDLYSPYCLIRVECTDLNGNIGRDVSDAFFAKSPISSNHAFSAGWNLISIPLDPADQSLESLFGDDFETQYHVYDFQQDRGFSRVDSIQRGRGYWIGLYEDVAVDLTGEAALDTVIFDLTEGWNLIGAPILWKSPLDSALFRSEGVTYDYEDALDASLILPVLYNYLSPGANYRESDELEPWLGYWFTAARNGVQMLLYPVVPTEQGRIVRDSGDEGTPDQWKFKLIAEINGVSDQITTLGADTSASDGFDVRYDFPEPPAPPGGEFVTAYFEHRNWQQLLGGKFNRDIRSKIEIEGSAVWIMTVETSREGTVVLNWPDLRDNLPEGYSAILIDSAAGRTIEMLSEERYEYESSGEREFAVRVTSPLVVDDDANTVAPADFILISAYPNPFNPSTTITYSLPRSGSAFLRLMDLTGREVASLFSGYQAAGEHTFNLEGGDLPPGTYLLQVVVAGISRSIEITLLK